MNNVAFPQCCSCTLLFIQRVAGRPFVWLTSCVMEAEHVTVSSTWARACTVSQVCNPAASQPCALHGGAQSVLQFVLDVLCCWTSASMKLTARVCSLLVLANVNACVSAGHVVWCYLYYTCVWRSPHSCGCHLSRGILEESLRQYGSLIPIHVDDVVEKLQDIFNENFSHPHRWDVVILLC